MKAAYMGQRVLSGSCRLISVIRDLPDTGRSTESYLPRCLQAGICVHVHVGLKAINGEGCCGFLFNFLFSSCCCSNILRQEKSKIGK